MSLNPIFNSNLSHQSTLPQVHACYAGLPGSSPVRAGDVWASEFAVELMAFCQPASGTFGFRDDGSLGVSRIEFGGDYADALAADASGEEVLAFLTTQYGRPTAEHRDGLTRHVTWWSERALVAFYFQRQPGPFGRHVTTTTVERFYRTQH